MCVKLFNPGELIRWDHLHRRSAPGIASVNYEREFQSVTGASLLMRRSLFDAIGGFDEEYVNGWEDVDLCLRVREAGYKVIYQPESVLTHHESISSGRFDREKVNAERFLSLWGGKIAADEPRLLRDDSEEELAQLCEVEVALRSSLIRFVAIPDLFPGGHQPMLVADPPGWRGRLARLKGRRVEQRLMSIHLFHCLDAMRLILSRLSSEKAR
jgi:Glycosyltransferase like family 2